MSHLSKIIIFIVGLGSFFYFISLTPRAADVLYVNGIVHTLDKNNHTAEAVAVRGKYIVGVGSSQDLQKHYRSKQVIDLQGETVMPGFVDAHVHMHGYGKLMQSILLYGITSPAEIIQLVKERVNTTNKGEYIIGRGWDQNLWAVKEFPNAKLLDNVSGEHPVVLIRVDGHACWTNSVAMKRAGITKETKDPPGGKIIRDAAGNPTGVFLDDARDLVESVIPPQSFDQVKANILTAIDECAKLGITEVHDTGINEQEIAVYEYLAKEKLLPIRVYASISLPDKAWNTWKERKPLIATGDEMLTIRSVKVYVDGALGSRGAALLEEYKDDPGNKGILITPEEKLVEGIRDAVRSGYQPLVHAIGDRGNRLALDAFEKVSDELQRDDFRGRIEHAQVINKNDIPRFNQLHILPSMQPVHATSDMYWAEARVGKSTIKGAYAWKSLISNGSIIPGGSDAPNDALNPLWGFYAASTRSDRNGYPQEGWYREEKMTREEAARCFTEWAAYGAFEEHYKGTIEAGKWADFTILSKDIMEIPAQEILSTDVIMTIVNGKVIYKKQ